MSSVLLDTGLLDSTSWYNSGYGGANTPANFAGGNPVPAGVIDNVTQGWCGAAFDYATSTMHVCDPGGHADSWNNQCYAIQVPGGPWRRTKAQTAFPPDQHVSGYAPVNLEDGLPTAGNGFRVDSGDGKTHMVNPMVSRDGVEAGANVYWDGSPSSRHTYGGTVWMANQQRVLLLNGACFGGFGDSYAGWFNPADGTWTRKNNTPGGGTGTAAAYDSVRGLVYWIRTGMSPIYKYDPVADTHVKMGPSAGSPLNSSIGAQYTQLCCDGSCTYVYAITMNGWPTSPAPYLPKSIARMRLGQTAQQPWEIVGISGDITGMIGNVPGFEYDPDKNAFVFWAWEYPGEISVLRLSDFQIYRVPITGAPPNTTNTIKGLWGRFRRYDTHRYCLMVSPRYPVYLITLA